MFVSCRLRGRTQFPKTTMFTSVLPRPGEIATKHRSAKLPGAVAVAVAVAVDIVGTVSDQGFDKLPISVEDAARAGALPAIHRDPFDRVLIAQPIVHDLLLVSSESRFDQYGVRRLW